MIDIVNGLLVRAGTVLLVRRSANRKAYPGKWSFPGGHTEEDETLDAALVREIGEELGITPTACERLEALIDPHPPRSAPITYHLYAITAWDGGEPTLQGDEHSELHWFSPDDAMLLPDLALPSYRRVLDAIRHRLD